MKRTDENRIVMFSTVNDYLNTNAPLWVGSPAIARAVGLLKSGIEAIQVARGRQGNATTGVTSAKQTLRGHCEDVVFEVLEALGALADETSDEVVAADVSFSLSAVQGFTTAKLLEVGKRVQALAAERKAALAEHGLEEATLTELGKSLESFDGAKTGPRKAIVERTVQTSSLPDLVAGVSGLLRNRLDRQLSAFRRKHAEFYAGYLSARVIIDRVGRKEKLEDAVQGNDRIEPQPTNRTA